MDSVEACEKLHANSSFDQAYHQQRCDVISTKIPVTGKGRIYIHMYVGTYIYWAYPCKDMYCIK